MDYWKECISEAFVDAEITATDEQIEIVAGFVQVSHECYGMAHGHDCIPNPLVLENKALKKSLQEERDKVMCKECGGKGWITNYGPYHSSTSQCWKCRGEGRHK